MLFITSAKLHFVLSFPLCYAFSALTLLVGCQEEHPACKNWLKRCWCGYLPRTRCRLFAYGPAESHCHPKTPSSLASFKPRLVRLPCKWPFSVVLLLSWIFKNTMIYVSQTCCAYCGATIILLTALRCVYFFTLLLYFWEKEQLKICFSTSWSCGINVVLFAVKWV